MTTKEPQREIIKRIDNTIRVQCFFEETTPLSALLPSVHNTTVFLGRASRR